jgi:FkbM family methyltransferase
MDDLLVSAPDSERRKAQARAFVAAFLDPGVRRPKLLFGSNVYAKSVLKSVSVDGVVDDYAAEDSYCGVPILRSDRIPPDALVLAVSGGRVLTVRDKLDALGVANLDYFAFRAEAPLPLAPIVFNDGFEEDFARNRDKYAQVASRFVDDQSRVIFRKLVSFRLSGDVEVLRGFTANEPDQYFEDFLALRPDGEVFHDIGCFDGATSLAFAQRCPNYRAIHAFEPEAGNRAICARNLAVLDRVTLHDVGLSSGPGEFAFRADGSVSSICATGSQTIKVVALDSLAIEPPTFLKLDIEGAELECVAGAADTIAAAHPRLAIAVYHYVDGGAPFWQIPERVLAIRDDYDVRLRHYTESIYETIMFFVPKAARP